MEQTNGAQPGQLPHRQWLMLMFAIATAVILCNVAVAWRLDPFGVLRNPRGRSLRPSEDERQAKFLMNESYVPMNFDALIIGASGSVNWRSDLLTGYRFYNESTFGGDATEERMMVEQALRKGKFKVAIVGFHPLITAKHVLQDGLDNVSRSETLGSVTSFRIEYEMVHSMLRPEPAYYLSDGSHPIPPQPPLKADDPGKLIYPIVDPKAVADYKAMVEELLAHGVKVIYVEYPLHEPHYRAVQQQTDNYRQWLLSVMPPAPFINFNDPDHQQFRSQTSNFLDEAHLSPAGAEILCRELNERVHGILRDQPQMNAAHLSGYADRTY